MVYLDRAGYRDVTDEPLSILDSLYYATVSLSTTGYGDITPVTESARLINILIITPLRVIFLIVLVGTTIEILTRRGTDTIREQNWKRKVKNHTVVIGYGVKGRTAVKSLLDSEEDGRSIVVITGSPAAASEASEQGVVTVVGDARSTDVLEQAMIDKAKKVIVAVDEDDATVLITGESGTGKELVARAIHANSSRAEQPFVAVSSSAASTELLESSLFGHVRDAFAGAVYPKKGSFDLADRGTVFFDEIGSVLLETQPKLLRVIQDFP